MVTNTIVANTNRASMIRMEDTSATWLLQGCYNELSFDVGLLMLSLMVFLFTRFGLRKKGSATAKGQFAKDQNLPKSKHPLVVPNAESPSSPQQLFSLLVKSDDRPHVTLLDVYRQYRTQADWAMVSQEDSYRIFANVCMAAARHGKSRVVESVFRDMDQLGVQRTPELYTTLLKMYSSKRHFQDTLALWQRMRAERVQNLERAAWSCLLFASSELNITEDAVFFFDKLVATGEASEKDYGNMIRHFAQHQEGAKAFACLEAMRAQGHEPDSYTYNAVFTLYCQSGTNLAVAESLFQSMKSVSGGVDAITYNTLLKSYAQAKRLEDAFSLVSEMESTGLSPTSVTYGTLLDACINEDDMDRATKVFNKMQEAQCELNTILYTTMIKGFAKMHKVDEVLHILKEMRGRGVEPDSVTYSLVLKTFCSAGQLESALDLFHSICSEGFQPDEIIFNNLLSGCVACKNMALAERLLKDMVRSNIAPSIATFSTLIKLYVECNDFMKAQKLLSNLEPLYGVASEPRLHWQLIHACLRARKRREVADVLELCIRRHGKPDSQELSKLLRSCCNFNMLDLALQLIEMSFASGTMVHCKDLQALADTAVKKKKPLVADSVAELASRHGVRLTN